MSYTITLATGKKITNLTMNGTNYVSKKEIDESIFTNEAMAEVTVSDGTNEEVHKNWVFVQQMKWEDGTYYLAFAEQDENAAKFLEIEEAMAELAELIVGGN